MKPLRVLVLMHPELMPPDTMEGHSEQEINVWKTEYDVLSTLRASGHDARALGVQNELQPIRDAVESWKPDVVFNLLEQFHGETAYDQNVASYLELLRVPYTGCNPRGLMLARGKDISKQLLAYHRVPVPAFAVFPMNRKVRRPKRLAFPLIVKSLSKDASEGISQASVVNSDERLVERVGFIHERIGTAAIAEQYIDGREIYVGALGNDRLRVLPIWELEFANLPRRARRIATEWVKHRTEYQEQRGVLQGPAEDLAAGGRSRASGAWSSASAGRSTSTAMPASISACRPRACPISSRPTPIPRSPPARNSPRPRSPTAFPIRS